MPDAGVVLLTYSVPLLPKFQWLVPASPVSQVTQQYPAVVLTLTKESEHTDPAAQPPTVQEGTATCDELPELQLPLASLLAVTT